MRLYLDNIIKVLYIITSISSIKIRMANNMHKTHIVALTIMTIYLIKLIMQPHRLILMITVTFSIAII
jgi:hypothetical protein